MKLSDKALRAPASGIRRMFNLAQQYENVINLCIGEPGFATPDAIVNAGRKALAEGHTKYTPNAGVIELRRAISRKLQRENKIMADPQTQILVTNGAGEAIFLALLALINPGDAVLIPEPCWPNYRGQLSAVGAVFVPVPTLEENGFAPSAAAIEAAITEKTRALILNTPSNPTGAVLERKELENIARVVKKHQIAVICDEPYEKIIYDDAEHISLASLEGMKERVVTVNSFSKTYAMTGWRVGYAAGTENVIEAMTKMQENVSSCVNAAAQQAGIAALEGSQEAVLRMAAAYRERRDILVTGLNGCKGISCRMPKGAFYAFANIKELRMSAEAAAEMLLEKARVVATPGNAFGKAGEGYLRFSFASEKAELEAAIERLQKCLNR